MFTSGLRQIVTLRGPDPRSGRYAGLLLERSEEFRSLWETHEVGVRPGQSHHLLVHTATPGSESHDKLRLLSVIGTQSVG